MKEKENYADLKIGSDLTGLARCPHLRCGVSKPYLMRVWDSSDAAMCLKPDGRDWAVFQCSSCRGLVTVEYATFVNPVPARAKVIGIFPPIWVPNLAVPQAARRFLQQAADTLQSPDASAIMASSAIDAMLKDKGLIECSLYVRINKAVAQGIITKDMAEWAHRVRLDANNPRHADEGNPHLAIEDAKRALDFARALAEILYVLPSMMPSNQTAENSGKAA